MHEKGKAPFWRRAVSVLASVGLAAALTPATALTALADEGGQLAPAGVQLAAQDATTGVAGTGVKWSLEDGVLTVSGDDSATISSFEDWTDKPADFSKLVIKGNNLTIAVKAFQGLAFTSVEFPDSVVKLGNSSFNNCDALKTIEMPVVTGEIGNNVFAECDELEFVVARGVAKDNVDVYDIANNVIEYASSILGAENTTKNGKCGTNLFANCTKLKKLVVAEGVEAVYASNVFGKMPALEGVVFPSTIKLIYPGLFNMGSTSKNPSLKWLYIRGTGSFVSEIKNGTYADGLFWNSETYNGTSHEGVTFYRGPGYEAIPGGDYDPVTVVPAAITAAEGAIAELPNADAVTSESESVIAAARTAYDAAIAAEGVDDVMKSWLDVDRLTAAETALAALDPLAGAKTTAVADLEAYKSADDYREAQKTELAKAVADGKAAIEAAEAQEAIDSALAAATSAIDAIPTDAQMTAAEQAVADAVADIDADNPTAGQAQAARAAYDKLDASQKSPALEAPILKAEAAVAKAAQAAAEQEANDARTAADQAAKDLATANEAKAKAESDAAAATADKESAERAQAEAEQKAKDAAEARAKAEKAAKDAADAQKAAEEKAAAAESAKAAAEQKAAASEKAAQAAKKAQAKAEKAQKGAEKEAASGVKANTMKVKAKTVSAKAKKKTVVKAKKAFAVKGAKGKVSYHKLSGPAKVKVSSKGKVTVAKGLKAGKTYKVKVLVTAKGGKVKGVQYAPAFKTVTLKVKVK